MRLEEEQILELIMSQSSDEDNWVPLQAPTPEILRTVVSWARALENSWSEFGIYEEIASTINQPMSGQDQILSAGVINLHAMYENYRKVPTMFSEDHMWSHAAILNQYLELSIDRGNEDIVEWKEDQSDSQRCLVCLTNVATRMAVPCGHRLCCRDCISILVNESMYYKVTTSIGSIITTNRRLPLQCITCRAIIGLIIVIR